MTVNCSKCKNLETQVRALKTTKSFTTAESKVIWHLSELIFIDFGCSSMSQMRILIARLLSVDSPFEVADQAIFEMGNWLDRMPGSKKLFSSILYDLKLSVYPGTLAMVFESICDEELTSDNEEIEFSVVLAVEWDAISAQSQCELNAHKRVMCILVMHVWKTTNVCTHIWSINSVDRPH